MEYFDFHYHHTLVREGIYNLGINELPPKKFFSAGLHPKDINGNYHFNMDWIRDISQHENCIAIGECGLDALLPINEEFQNKVFEEQILWANEIKKPIIVHCVRRYAELLKFKKMAKVPMILHGFHKKQRVADELLSHGFYLSFGKAVLHDVSLQQTLARFPLEKLFLETDDAHFDLLELYRVTADLKNISVEKLQEEILKNVEKIMA